MATETTYLKTLVEQVKDEKDPIKSISRLADVVVAMDNENSSRHTAIEVKIDKLSIAILGNGEPENSLMARVGKLSQRQKWIFGGLAFVLTTGGGWLIVEILNRL